MLLGAAGPLRGIVTVEHYHDLGKLLFGFLIFWAYIGFSQMMLIWMANIPEETLWFFHRWSAPQWQSVSWFLLWGHFVLPFLYLMPRTIKRTRPLMAAGALWMLLAHYIDLYWLIFPAYDPERVALHWVDFFMPVGMGLVFLGAVVGWLRRAAPTPIRDPYLAESIAFENT
jgi:hypothetical protein